MLTIKTPRRKTATASRKAIAIHQAGHAVIACLLDIPFLAVTPQGLQRQDECPLWAIPGSGPVFQPERARQRVDREICAIFAGPIAESIHNDWDWKLTKRGRQDRDYAIELTWDLEHEWEARRAWVDRIREIALDFFAMLDVWNVVKEVAHQLQRDGTVTRNQVRGIARTQLKVPQQLDERHSYEESRWRWLEHARHLGTRPSDTADTPTVEQVFAGLNAPIVRMAVA
jgi:hypothetical protein